MGLGVIVAEEAVTGDERSVCVCVLSCGLACAVWGRSEAFGGVEGIVQSMPGHLLKQ